MLLCYFTRKTKKAAAAMERRPLIADLSSQDQDGGGAPATISFHDLELSTQGSSPAIVGYHHLPAGTDSKGVDSRHTKAFIKGHKAAVQVADLFNNNNNNNNKSYHHGGNREPTSIPMRVTSSGLIKGPSSDEEQGQNFHDAILWFEKTQFQFPALTTTATGSRTSTSTHYLHFSNPPPPQTASVSGLHDITLISGVCLFSERLLSASIPKEGHGVHAEVLELPKPTLYEVGSIARAAPVIADLIAVLGDDDGTSHSNGDSSLCRDDNDHGFNHNLSLYLDVPSFHYYQTVDTRLRDGLCTFPQAIRWMAAVEKRHHQLTRVFHRYVENELSRRPRQRRRQRQRQRQNTDSSQEIAPSPPVSLVCDIIRDSLQNERLPCLDHVLQMLTIHDPIWTAFYALVPEKERPRDFHDLGYLFYVYQVVRPALIQQPQQQHNPLMISIDDIHERRIYNRAQKLLRRIRTTTEYPSTPHLLEMYICNRVFIDQNREREQGRAELYCRDPSPGGVVVEGRSLCRSISADGHGDGDGDGCCENGGSGIMLDAFDVVSVLYGCHAGTVLKGLFAEEGLGGLKVGYSSTSYPNLRGKLWLGLRKASENITMYVL